MININDFVLQGIDLQVLTVNLSSPQISISVNFSAVFKGDQHAQQGD